MTSASTRLSRVSITIAAVPTIVLAALLAVPASAGPAYLKIGDIKGESTAKGFEGQIEIQSWSWGESRSGVAKIDGLKHETDVIEGGENKSKGKVEYTWKVEEGEAAAASHEAEITLKGAAVKPGRTKVGDITLKRGMTEEASGGVNVAAGDVNNAAGAASGLPTGKRQHKPFAVTKPVDKAAGSLTAIVPAGMCKAGARYPTAELGTGEAVYRLRDVIVTSCAPVASADGGSRPTETMSLNYEEIK